MAAGFEQVVARAIRRDAPDATVERVESGSISLVAPYPTASRLASLPYLSLVLLRLARTEQADLDRAVAHLASQVRDQAVPGVLRRSRTFRVRITDDGHLVRVDSRSRRALEAAIARWAGIPADPRGGGAEVWVVRRRGEQEVALLVRLGESVRERVPKGALKADLAAALVRTVPASSNDVVLDPFAGSGAIAQARASLPHALLVASDIDKSSTAGLADLQRRGSLGRHARVVRCDARDAGCLAKLLDDRPVNTVITDPPWGHFVDASAGDLADLYSETFASMRELMAPDGQAVVLTGIPETAVGTAASQGFQVTETFPVLVNGRKAAVIVSSPETG